MLFRKRPPQVSTDLQAMARQTGDAFRNSGYYADAEPAMDYQLQEFILPILRRYHEEIDYTSVLDFAAGHGRNSAWLRRSAEHITLVDISQENLRACEERFGKSQQFSYVPTDGTTLQAVKSNTISFLYSFDSMVHFDSDVVLGFIPEFKRVMARGSYCFCHHSNYTANPGGSFRDNPEWRNFMSKELFAHALIKNGLEVVEQKVIGWGNIADLDCITLFRESSKRKLLGIL